MTTPFNTTYRVLVMNICRDIETYDTRCPWLSFVGQLLTPEEASIIRKESLITWTMLKDIHRPIHSCDDIIPWDLSTDDVRFTPLIIRG
jgi:hypothetical protein